MDDEPEDFPDIDHLELPPLGYILNLLALLSEPPSNLRN